VLNKTIGIHFVDFEYFKDERYVRRLVFKDAETNEYHESLGYLELYFIEMNKAVRYAGDLSNSLNRWIKFLNEATSFDKQGVPDAIASDAEIARALAKLEAMGLTQNEREIYESEVKANMVEAAELEYATKNAEIKGEIKGKEELVLRLISRRVGDFPQDLAQKLDRLSGNELDDLGEALLDFTTYADVEAWLADHS
jgi:predicted transposase/invertase (TIGR01784 family)